MTDSQRQRPPANSAQEPQRAAVQYPGGLRARYRWAGSAGAGSLRAVTESSGSLTDHGALISTEPDRLCRAELRIEGPLGIWTARFASPISDEPSGFYWDTPGLLVIKYGFATYALAGRTGELRWWHESRTPLLTVLGSSRLPHVIAQSEVETFALRDDGEVAWRLAHADVVVGAELVGGRLVLTSYGGSYQPLDPLTGQTRG